MSKKIIIIFIFLCKIEFSSARAKIPIPVCIPCETLTKIKELPDTASLVGENQEHLNLGYIYNEYGFLWIPIWNTEGRIVLINKNEDKYYEVSEAELKSLSEIHHFEIASNPLSFWKKLGGKLIILLVLGLFIWSKFFRK